MAKTDLIEEMHRYRLVAVLRSSTSAEAVSTAQAVAEAGVKFVEITLSVPGALGVIEKLARTEGLHVAGGTVLSKKDAQRAIAAGAKGAGERGGPCFHRYEVDERPLRR